MNRASTAAPLPVQAPVELLDGSYQVTDTTSTGLSGTWQWQKEPAPPENNVKETNKQPPKGSKLGGAGVLVAKKEPRSGSPEERQALLLQDHCASEDTNLRSCHSETTTPPAICKTEERAPSPEHLEWQKDQDYICSLDKNCVSSAASLLAQAPVKTLDDTPWMDTLSTGLSGERQQQEEPAPPEDDVNDERSSKGSKVGKAEVPVAKEQMSRIPLIVQAVLLHNSSASKDVNHQSCCPETMLNLGMSTTTPVFHNQLSILRTAVKLMKKRLLGTAMAIGSLCYQKDALHSGYSPTKSSP